MSAIRERRGVAAAGVAGLAVLMTIVAGCGGQSGTGNAAEPRSGAHVTVDSRSVPGFGKVLVNDKGYALYMFEPDSQRQVTCTGLCAATWPPVRIVDSASLAAGPGVSSARLSSDPDPAGGRVVTYNGWPLYTYTGDVAPGQVTGQGIDLNGGDWYLMRPSGQPITTGLG